MAMTEACGGSVDGTDEMLVRASSVAAQIGLIVHQTRPMPS